jgi:hypothetical protein
LLIEKRLRRSWIFEGFLNDGERYRAERENRLSGPLRDYGSLAAFFSAASNY